MVTLSLELYLAQFLKIFPWSYYKWSSIPRYSVQFSSVQSLSRVWLFATHGLQHARLLCPSPTPRVYSNSCPLSQWCHPTIPSSVVPFSSHLQSFPASGSFPMSQLFASGSQSIGVFSFNISPSSEHSGLISFRMDWLDLLAVQGTLKSQQRSSLKQPSAHPFS